MAPLTPEMAMRRQGVALSGLSAAGSVIAIALWLLVGVLAGLATLAFTLVGLTWLITRAAASGRRRTEAMPEEAEEAG